jgi:hypothetical protein
MLTERVLSSASGQETKSQCKSLTIKEKMEVIWQMEKGETWPDVCCVFTLVSSTVTAIMKNVETTKQPSQSAVNIGAGPSYNTYSQNKTVEIMEKLLVVWIEDMTQHHLPLTESLIRYEVKSLFDELSGEEDGSNDFTASRGWCFRFKNRTKIHNVKMSGEAASADITAANEFQIHFQKLVDEEKLTKRASTGKSYPTVSSLLVKNVGDL